MHRESRSAFRRWFLLGSMAMVALSGAARAGSDMAWPQSHADLMDYHGAGLPDPVVIYAYDAQGRLLRVFGVDGRNGFEDMKKMRAIIAGGTIDAATDTAAGTDARLREFLDTEGISSESVFGGNTPYHLVLVVPDTGSAPCPPCENYRAMLAEATAAPAAQNRFSVYTLKLGAPGQAFRVVE